MLPHRFAQRHAAPLAITNEDLGAATTRGLGRRKFGSERLEVVQPSSTREKAPTHGDDTGDSTVTAADLCAHGTRG